jgi:hypothetical protein
LTGSLDHAELITAINEQWNLKSPTLRLPPSQPVADAITLIHELCP